MEKESLSAREAALIAQARREAEARKEGAAAGPSQAAPRAARQPEAPARPKPGPAERLAQLMAEEHAETERRKKKMRRYGILIPAAILAVFALWLLRALTRRR
jgi:flagellar biosynthesis/type III secretory pathway protein FliH